MEKIEIVVTNTGEGQHRIIAPLPVELGRQSADDSALFTLQDLGSYHRVAIAPIGNVAIPRRYLQLAWSKNRQIRITNIHSRAKFRIESIQRVLEPNQSVDIDRNALITLPDGLGILIQVIEIPDSIESKPSSHGYRTIASSPFQEECVNTEARLGQLIREGSEGRQGNVAVQLVRQSLDVLKKAAGSDEYFDAAVRAVASMIELDRVYVILYSNSEWKTRACFSSETDTASSYTDSAETTALPSGSSLLLQRVLDTKQTLVYEPQNYMFTADTSMMALDRAVAAPMLDEKGNVSGALYGDRKFGENRIDEPIGELEAALLEVMASAVASGLARQKEEVIRSSLAQFFSPAVTQRLEKDEDLLSGRDADVTVLFCDIRGFSGIAERVGPKATIEWINDVLTDLSECVTQTDGVLVDYIGDELMAMWGAPADQSDHAVRACRSALEMIERVEPLRERHASITPDHFGIGIGINSGIARVGNTGSRVKFKYGPLGNTVNVASRVQGMTKKFGVPILMTESTQRLLDVPSIHCPAHSFAHRRIADVKPLGVTEVVRLYQLAAGISDDWSGLRDSYERALNYYHNADLTNAAKELATLVHQYPSDSPSVLLLGRVVTALTNPEVRGDPVFAFDSK